MKNRTILALAPFIVAFSLQIGACSDTSPSGPAAGDAPPTPGSIFKFRVWETDSAGKTSPDMEFRKTVTLLNTTANAGGQKNVRTFLSNFGDTTTSEPDTLYYAHESNGDVKMITALYGNTDVPTPYSQWTPFPVASKAPRTVVFTDTTTADGSHISISATSRYIGAENIMVGSKSIATIHVQVTNTFIFGNDSSSLVLEQWYAPSLEQLVKSKIFDPRSKSSYNEQMTEFKLR